MPVLWTQSVPELASLGVTAIIACGPNKELCGLMKRIDKSLVLKDTNSIESLENI
jgi:[acyl-carrier-protein] S-malonyltransferase